MRNAYRLAILGHLGLVAVGLAGTFGGFATTAQAAPVRGGYEARLAAPLDGPRMEVLSGVAWNCTGDACAAPKASSRPEVVCARLVRKFGQVTSFTAMGEALDAEALARCNGGA
ncbi:MAG: hypothetical protein ABW203_08580 [Novosphingobium sp.]